MIIHQIFLKVSDKNIEDYPCFVEGSNLWKQWCLDNGWEYKLWTEIPYDILDEKDKIVLEETTKRFYFAPIDFIRMPLLEHYGGMYVDLDTHPTDKTIEIMDREYIFGADCKYDKDGNVIKTWNCNNVMKCSKETARQMRLYSHQCFDEKMKIEIYKTWRIRFFLRTVGVSMVTTFCKKILKHKPMSVKEFNTYFTEHGARSWNE